MGTLGFNICMPNLPSQYWPATVPGETADFSFDATDLITNNGTVDPIISATIQTRPSGTGELAPTSLVVTSTGGAWVATAWLSGGVASRNYIHLLTLNLQSGQTIPVIIGQVCDPTLAIPPIPPPPSPTFSAAISWNSGASPTPAPTPLSAVATGLTATGTTQATALLLTAVNNVFTTVAAGSGAILPSNITASQITVYASNFGANDLLMYPPVGAKFNGMAVNAPISIAPNQTVTFTSSNLTALWYAQ